MKELRKIEFYQKFFLEFYVKLPLKVQRKYDYVFIIIRQAARIPIKFFKKIVGQENLYEIRVEYGSNIYRTFCCFNGQNVVVLFNSFQKKSQKTPKDQLARAVKLKNQYFNEKK